MEDSSETSFLFLFPSLCSPLSAKLDDQWGDFLPSSGGFFAAVCRFCLQVWNSLCDEEKKKEKKSRIWGPPAVFLFNLALRGEEEEEDEDEEEEEEGRNYSRSGNRVLRVLFAIVRRVGEGRIKVAGVKPEETRRTRALWFGHFNLHAHTPWMQVILLCFVLWFARFMFSWFWLLYAM